MFHLHVNLCLSDGLTRLRARCPFQIISYLRIAVFGPTSRYYQPRPDFLASCGSPPAVPVRPPTAGTPDVTPRAARLRNWSGTGQGPTENGRASRGDVTFVCHQPSARHHQPSPRDISVTASPRSRCRHRHGAGPELCNCRPFPRAPLSAPVSLDDQRPAPPAAAVTSAGRPSRRRR